MGIMAPPYLNKNIKSLEKDLARAEAKEKKAQIEYESAKQLTELYRKALEDAKKQG